MQEINSEYTRIDFVIYRLEVDNITNALLAKFQAGVPVRIIVEPNAVHELATTRSIWLTHANIDKLWAAGVPIRQTAARGRHAHEDAHHVDLRDERVVELRTELAARSQLLRVGSDKPAIYQAIENRFQTMWNDTVGLRAARCPSRPTRRRSQAPPPARSTSPTTTSLVWNIAACAVSYDVYLGTSSANMTLVGNVPAPTGQQPADDVFLDAADPLQPGTTYFWKVVSRTNATPLDPDADRDLVHMVVHDGRALPVRRRRRRARARRTGRRASSTTPTLGWSPGAPERRSTSRSGRAIRRRRWQPA